MALAKDKTLCIFTTAFPFSKGENFVENEINQASLHFKEVMVFPFKKLTTESISPIDNFAITPPSKISWLSKGAVLITHLYLVLKIILLEYRNCTSKTFFLVNCHKWLSRISESLVLSKKISKFIKENQDSELIFYSFWMKEWALALAMLKAQNKIDSFFFRCNGIDIYDERRDGNYMPFRFFIYSKTNLVIPNSKTSASYLKRKDIFPRKIVPYYLGTTDEGVSKLEQNKVLKVVTCGRISPEKRNFLVVEILNNVSVKVQWTHIGGSKKGIDQLKEWSEKLNKNISFSYTGFLPSQQDIYSFYRNNEVHLMINTSEFEGLPVTLQEAISFGIPCMATDVGGVREVTNKQTGILIEKNFKPKTVALLLDNFLESSYCTVEFRKGARKYWEQNFKSKTIYPQFVSLIMEKAS